MIIRTQIDRLTLLGLIFFRFLYRPIPRLDIRQVRVNLAGKNAISIRLIFALCLRNRRLFLPLQLMRFFDVNSTYPHHGIVINKLRFVMVKPHLIGLEELGIQLDGSWPFLRLHVLRHFLDRLPRI